MSAGQSKGVRGSKRRRVLLTGASGIIGTEVVRRLVDAGDAVTALVHENSELVQNDGRTIPYASGHLEGVQGDVGRSRLGLPEADYRELQKATDVIVHSAAVTEFGRPQSLYQRINEGGTKRILEFAQDSLPSPIPVVHISTAYVCGNRHGIVLEDELEAEQEFANAYERSKFNAELLVREAAAKGLPAAVVRPSIVVGSSRNGVTREFSNIYVLLKLIADGQLSIIPANYDAVLDLVPIDYVADFIAEVTGRVQEAAGKVFHAVGEAPLTLRECGDVLAEYPSFRVPRFVPPQSFDPDRLSPIERRYYERVLVLFEPYLRRHVVFSADQAQGFSGMRQASRGKAMLRRLLDYCLQQGYLGVPRPTITDVLGSLRSSQAPAVSSPTG